MARVLKRCRSTMFRELKRNHFSDESMPKHDGYYGAAAHLMTADRRWPQLQAKIGTQTWFCEKMLEEMR
jgi:IS30 family transposase